MEGRLKANISLIEEHHEALAIWRKKGFKNLDLVHIDAHSDFGFPVAKPIEQVFKEANDIKGLKRGLEQTLAFMQYEKNLDKQTNIGNYIYPAMNEGIVRDFYWVIPGGPKEFRESLKSIKVLLKPFSKRDPYRVSSKLKATGIRYREGIITATLLGRRFVICVLDKLPVFKNKVLLDIDTDFLVIDSLKNANNTSMIGKRKPWILPDKFVDILSEKIKNTLFTTIAYSVNGGYTPIKYKHFGDELAYSLSKGNLCRRFSRNLKAGEYFNLFGSTGEKKYYQKAIKLDPSYRVADNNYGPLYLSIDKLARAKKEYKKILCVDSGNPHPFIGLGNVALRRRDYSRAEKFFYYALKRKRDLPEALFGLAQAKFNLKKYLESRRLFSKYQATKPMHPQSYYFLGRIYEKEGRFNEAMVKYHHAMRLGLNNLDIIYRLLKVALRVDGKDDIIQLVSIRYKEFEKRLNMNKRLRGIKRKMIGIERLLKHGGRNYA